MEIYFFSFTETSKKIANFIGKKLNIQPKEIKSYKLPYFLWLLLSFIPYLSLKAYFPSPSKEIIILCFPKWTFNCPPITYFLKKIKCQKLILIISYGGWGEKKYAEFYKKLALKSCKEVYVFLIKNKIWQKMEIKSF